MGRNTWIAGLALGAGLLVPQPADGQTHTVRVVLTNLADVPPATLEVAKEEAVRLFARSKIQLEWINAAACEDRCLFVRIISDPIGTKGRDNQFVVGVAPGTEEVRGKFAWIFYDRIKVYSEHLGLGAAQMVGDVIAHELGHLLLPHGAHSVAGIMRADWDKSQARSAVTGQISFTVDQAALIRERLQASASPIARVQ